MALAYLEKKNYDEVISSLRQRLATTKSAAVLQALGYAYARSGKPEEAQKVLARLLQLRDKEYVSPYFIGLVYLGLGKKDRAFEWFEKGCDDHSPWMLSLKVLPLYDSLHTDARYKALMLQMNLKH